MISLPSGCLRLHVVALALCALVLSQIPARAQEPAAAAPQTVSQSGLLPVFGVNVTLNPQWVDGTQFPSASPQFPHQGVSAQLHQIWEGLRPTGLGVLRMNVDVRSPDEAARRVANLVVWGQQNNVKLVPMLVGADRGQPVGVEYAQNVAAFVRALSAHLAVEDGRYRPAYTQIMLFQLENNLNHPGLHGGMSAEVGQLRLAQAATALRKAEQESFKDTGMAATPLMANASFDYELLKTKAIAGTPLAPEAIETATGTFKSFVAELAAAPDIDVINVEWFPGSLSAGSVDLFPQILPALLERVAGKQLVVTTGFSTAFRPAEEQKNFYSVAFANLADFRANQGPESPFLGMFFNEATNAAAADASTSPFAAEIATWDWSVKATELMQMWRGEAASPALQWWLTRVESQMGMQAWSGPDGTAVTPKPAQEALTLIAQAATDASAAMAAAPPTPSTEPIPQDAAAAAAPPADPSAGPAVSSELKEKFKAGLMGLLDVMFQKLGERLVGGGSSGASSAAGAAFTPTDPTIFTPPPPAATTGAPMIRLNTGSVVLSATSAQVGTPVTVEVAVVNGGNGDGVDLMVALVDEATNTLLGMETQVAGVMVTAGNEQKVTMTWTPTIEGSFKVAGKVFDAGANELASRSAGSVTVAAAPPVAETPPAATEPAAPGTTVPPATTPTTPPATDVSAPGGGTPAGSRRVVPPFRTITNIERLKQMLPLGLPQLAQVQIAGGAARIHSGQAAPLSMSLMNPYPRPLSGVVVTMRVGGKVVATRQVGTMLPKQRRAVTFNEVTFARPGLHDVSVAIQSGGAKSLTGNVSGQVRVQAPPRVAPAPPTAIPAAPTAPVSTKPKVVVRSPLPTSFKVGKLALPAAPPPPPAAPRPADAKPAGPARPGPATPAVQPPQPRPVSPTPAPPGAAPPAQPPATPPPAVRPPIAQPITRPPIVQPPSTQPPATPPPAAPPPAVQPPIAQPIVRPPIVQPPSTQPPATPPPATQPPGVRPPIAQPIARPPVAQPPPTQPPSTPPPATQPPGVRPPIAQPIARPPAAQPPPTQPPASPISVPGRTPASRGTQAADLGISASDIDGPAALTPGTMATFVVRVRNHGGADVANARVNCILRGPSSAAAPPSAISVPGGGTASARCSFKVPAGGPWRLEVSVSGPDANPSNNSAVLQVREARGGRGPIRQPL